MGRDACREDDDEAQKWQGQLISQNQQRRAAEVAKAAKGGLVSDAEGRQEQEARDQFRQVAFQELGNTLERQPGQKAEDEASPGMAVRKM